MRRDWMDILPYWVMGFTVGAVVMAVLLALASCTAWQVPRAHGDPCTPHGGTWSDSLARCVPQAGPHHCTSPSEWSDSLRRCVVWMTDTTGGQVTRDSMKVAR